jgi:hypothetical protein
VGKICPTRSKWDHVSSRIHADRYPSPQNAPRLRNNAAVAKRIEELQARNERKFEMAALSRDELIGILAEVVHAARARLSEARLGDGITALMRRESFKVNVKRVTDSTRRRNQGEQKTTT